MFNAKRGFDKINIRISECPTAFLYFITIHQKGKLFIRPVKSVAHSHQLV